MLVYTCDHHPFHTCAHCTFSILFAPCDFHVAAENLHDRFASFKHSPWSFPLLDLGPPWFRSSSTCMCVYETTHKFAHAPSRNFTQQLVGLPIFVNVYELYAKNNRFPQNWIQVYFHIFVGNGICIWFRLTSESIYMASWAHLVVSCQQTFHDVFLPIKILKYRIRFIWKFEFLYSKF